MQDIASLSKTLINQSLPIQDRFRALFTLRSLETNQAAVQALIDALAADSSLSSSSADDDGGDDDAHQKLSSLHADALFRHEVAFALGQMRAKAATATLISVLKNQREHGMTRHECAEALGAIADETSLEVLKDMREDSKHREVRETASLALRRVEYMVGSRDESTATSTTTATNNTTFNNSTGAIVGSKKESIGKVAAVNEQEEEFAYSVDLVPAMDESIETETLAEIILDDARTFGTDTQLCLLCETARKKRSAWQKLERTNGSSSSVPLRSAKPCARKRSNPRCSNTKSVTSSVNSEKTTTTKSRAKLCLNVWKTRTNTPWCATKPPRPSAREVAEAPRLFCVNIYPARIESLAKVAKSRWTC